MQEQQQQQPHQQQQRKQQQQQQQELYVHNMWYNWLRVGSLSSFPFIWYVHACTRRSTAKIAFIVICMNGFGFFFWFFVARKFGMSALLW